jgi:uncharacterized membrane protein
MPDQPQAVARGDSTQADSSLVTYTHIIYALHATAVVIGIVGASTTVVGAFLLGVPSLVAVVMNYVRRGDVRGTWLDSHFSWQIRTFWFTALWVVIIGVVSAVTLPLLGLGLVIFFVSFGLLALWLIYRVARGWLRLADGKPMYV